MSSHSGSRRGASRAPTRMLVRAASGLGLHQVEPAELQQCLDVELTLPSGSSRATLLEAAIRLLEPPVRPPLGLRQPGRNLMT